MSRWAVFLSGKGSTAQALFDLAENIDIRWVVSNKKTAYGLARARRMGIPILQFHNKMDWNEIHWQLKRRKIENIFLLGFMKLIPAEFVNKWQGHLFNIHPSLLPSYPGLHAIERSFSDKAEMGVTIHHVVPEMDAGKIIYQRKVTDQKNNFEWSQTVLKMAAAEQQLIRHMGMKIL